MKNWTLWATAMALTASAGAVLAQTTVLGPSITSVSLSSIGGTMNALAANPSRKALTVCNNDATNKITIATGATSPVALTTGIVLLNGNVATSCITFGQPGGGASGGVGAQVNAAPSATPLAITFIEYF